MLVEKDLSFCDLEVYSKEKPWVIACHLLYQLKLGASSETTFTHQPMLRASTAKKVVILIGQLNLLFWVLEETDYLEHIPLSFEKLVLVYLVGL